MQYITSVERVGYKRGMLEGEKRGEKRGEKKGKKKGVKGTIKFLEALYREGLLSDEQFKAKLIPLQEQLEKLTESSETIH